MLVRLRRRLRAAAAGEDPAAEKHATRQGETVADLAREYIERHAKKHKRSWEEDVRKLLNFAVQRDWIDANPAALIAEI